MKIYHELTNVRICSIVGECVFSNIADVSFKSFPKSVVWKSRMVDSGRFLVKYL